MLNTGPITALRQELDWSGNLYELFANNSEFRDAPEDFSSEFQRLWEGAYEAYCDLARAEEEIIALLMANGDTN